MSNYTVLNDKAYEVLRVTEDGEFIWHEDADRLIEEGDYSLTPAMKHILKALRHIQNDHGFDRTASHMAGEYVDTAQPEQEPIAWMNKDGWIGLYKQGDATIPLYTAQPSKPWVSLTMRDYHELLNLGTFEAFKAIDALLKERNNG